MNQYVHQMKQLAGDTKYTRWYISIVENARTRASSRKEAKSLFGYTEEHHILPKSFGLGGVKDRENFSYLTAREHFVCHWLLSKMFTNGNFYEKMVHALAQMAYVNTSTQERYLTKITSRVFEKNRLKKRDIQGQPVIVDGVEYPNVSAAARSTGITVGSMNKRVRSPYFPNIQFRRLK